MKKSNKKARVSLSGGDLEVELLLNNHIYITGPAVTVFAGQIA